MYLKAWHVQDLPTARGGAQMHLRCDLDFLEEAAIERRVRFKYFVGAESSENCDG